MNAKLPGMTPKRIVFLPTLNERANLQYLFERLERLPLPRFKVLVIDDRSPDGTADFVRNYRGTRFDAEVLVRQGLRGRGLAGRDAFHRAALEEADELIEMDADGSHDPAEIPALLEARARAGADLVVGSRRLGITQSYGEWPIARRLLTAATNLFARTVLGVPCWDCNSGFRCYGRAAIAAVEAAGIAATGSDVVHETLFRIYAAGLRVIESPIRYHDRRAGNSTKTSTDLFRALATCVRLRASRN